MAGVSFTLKAPKSIIEKRGLTAGGAVQKLIDKEVLKRCEPYVPKMSGALIKSGESSTKIGSGKVTYNTPYAAYQYYGVSAKGKSLKYNGAPMRGSYWFLRMKSVNGDAILNLAAKEAGAAGVLTAKTTNQKKRYVPKTQPIKTVIGMRKNPVF